MSHLAELPDLLSVGYQAEDREPLHKEQGI